MKRYFISSILFLGAALMFCGCPKNLGGKPEPEPIFYYQFTKINETTDFFDNNTVKSFAVIHRGESGEAEFCIGTLITQKGSYRTTLNLKQKGDKKVLQEVKFEK